MRFWGNGGCLGISEVSRQHNVFASSIEFFEWGLYDIFRTLWVPRSCTALRGTTLHPGRFNIFDVIRYELPFKYFLFWVRCEEKYRVFLENDFIRVFLNRIWALRTFLAAVVMISDSSSSAAWTPLPSGADRTRPESGIWMLLPELLFHPRPNDQHPSPRSSHAAQ